MNIDDFKALACETGACWKCREFTDGGVRVVLGAGWCAFMLDEHCTNKHGCVGAKHRKGEMCDAIGVHEQDNNDRFRIIEAKRGGVASKAMIQLQHGADYLDAAIGPAVKARFTAELHTGPGPASTARAFNSIEIRSRKLRVPVAIRQGS